MENFTTENKQRWNCENVLNCSRQLRIIISINFCYIHWYLINHFHMTSIDFAISSIFFCATRQAVIAIDSSDRPLTIPFLTGTSTCYQVTIDNYTIFLVLVLIFAFFHHCFCTSSVRCHCATYTHVVYLWRAWFRGCTNCRAIERPYLSCSLSNLPTSIY